MGSAVVDVWQYKGSLAQLSGTGLLNAFGPQQSGTITDLNGVLSQGDDFLSTFSVSGGAASGLDYIGYGTMSLASVSVLGVTLVKLSPVPAVAFQSAGAIWLMLPQGFPSLLGLNLSSLTASFSLDPNRSYSLAGFIPCFVEGTRLLSPSGEIAVEDVRVGDALLGVDGRLNWVLWCGSTVAHPVSDWPDDPRHPVRIGAGTFGHGRPRRDLYVSQQHRIALETRSGYVFAKAKHLAPDHASIDRDWQRVPYYHVMTRHHCALVSENLASESFFPGPVAMEMMSPRLRAEIVQALEDTRLSLAFPEVNRRALREVLRGQEIATAEPAGRGSARRRDRRPVPAGG